MAKEITVLSDDNFKEEVLSSDLPAVVDFWAEWCGPCKMISPIIEQLAEEFAGKIKVCKLNVEEAKSVASEYRIMNIPTLLLFKDGTLVDTIIGVLPKDSIAQRMQELIG